MRIPEMGVVTQIEEADDRLFNSIVFYEQHLLHWLLTERHYTNYNLSLDHGAMTALC